MRSWTIITLLLFVIAFVWGQQSKQEKRKIKGQENKEVAKSNEKDSLSVVSAAPVLSDSISPKADSTETDSLQRAINLHNQLVDDSLKRDSINRTKKNTLDAPMSYSGNDSMVYNALTRTSRMYGSVKINYENMDLSSDKVRMSIDSSIVYATGTTDSTAKNKLKETPIFTMGGTKYESDTMAFNFKSKRGLINQVKTEQEGGFLASEKAKRDSTGDIYLEHGRYTTCDKDHPDFYIALSRAKVRTGKDVVFGPAYLVVADVPLPIAIPYGFFPFTKSYSSGFLMPTYGDESTRGFYLRDGGYYFAINDIWDLKLLGEIYTKGSWGLSAASNYRKRYRYSGTFYFSYQDTRSGEKSMPDYSKQTSFKIQWSHRQDTKANPFSTLAASVNFATTSYERNNLTSLYNPQSLTQSTRTSSVSWSTTFSSIGMSLSSTANLSQNMRDSSIAMTLPDLNISISRFYPFKRKKIAGTERWYEKISMSYTGQLSNSISTKENLLMRSNLIKDWKNGMQHSIPINGNFTVLRYISLNPSISITDRMYTNKIMRSWDQTTQTEIADTTYGFYNIYNWSMSVSASTKLYGFYIPNRKIFGDKISAIRHVFTPQITFSYAPDFGSRRYGYHDSYQKTDANGDVTLVEYSPFSNGMFGVPGRGKTGNINFDISNNIEMKIRSDKDSSGFKRLSIIDELGASMSYNMATDYHPLSDLSMRLRLKWWKSYTFSLNAVFASYAYALDNNGRPYVSNNTMWGMGKFGRFQGMSQNLSFTLTPDKIKRLFGGGRDNDDKKNKKKNNSDDEGIDTDINSNIDDKMVNAQKGAENEGKTETDDDGYMKFSMPWSFTIGYGITMREGNDVNRFNYSSMRYPYVFTQSLNFSGNIRIAEGWNISFSSGYDFVSHSISMTTASLQRDLHCFNMSCSVVLAPYTSYNFSFRCNASTLTDALKYDKRSGYTNAVRWY